MCLTFSIIVMHVLQDNSYSDNLFGKIFAGVPCVINYDDSIARRVAWLTNNV